MCAAWSFVLNVEALTPDAKSSPRALEAFQRLRGYERLLGNPATPRKVSSRAAYIIGRFQSFNEYRKYLSDDSWEDIEYFLGVVLHQTQPLFLYVDDIDRNYAWAPGIWTQCQRGLFYAVFSLLKQEILRNKLHVVVALRDTTLATIASGEHATRYAEEVHINHLKWTRESVLFFLDEKLRQLPPTFFSGPKRSYESWLGLPHVTNSRKHASSEGVGSYIIRHTRLLPRDIVYVGNAICTHVQENGMKPIDEGTLRDIVSRTSRSVVRAELSSLRNEIRSDSLEVTVEGEDGSGAVTNGRERDISAILDAISATSFEKFNAAVLPEFESTLEETFNAGEQGTTGRRVTNLLWQHRLLSWVDITGQSHFFEPSDFFGRSELPRSQEVWGYQWHCMMFDICPTLRDNAHSPAFP